jgi:hypothetical protein
MFVDPIGNQQAEFRTPPGVAVVKGRDSNEMFPDPGQFIGVVTAGKVL